MNSRPQLLKQLNGIRRGRIELSSIYDEWKVKTFYVYKELPGYVLDSGLQPVDPDVFNEILFSWPGSKLKVRMQDDTQESIFKSMKKFVFHGSYDFLEALVPEETAKMWAEELAKKQKQKEKDAQEAMMMQQRIKERWATLHPLNQEWGIPPPPTDIETDKDHRLNDWVHQYWPYMYERNGYLHRKMSTGRYDSMYERSFKDGTFDRNETHKGELLFARDDEEGTRSDRSRLVHPQEANTQVSKPEMTERERKIEEKRLWNENYMIEYKKRFIGVLAEDQPQPPTQNRYNFKIIDPVNRDERIKQIADAMRGLKR